MRIYMGMFNFYYEKCEEIEIFKLLKIRKSFK